MRSLRAIFIVAIVAAALVPGVARSSSHGVMAGVGVADATWHVGVGSGQYSDKVPNVLGLATGGQTDPFNHANVQKPSYGVESRLTYRALVVQDADSEPVALVKTDAYLAQDHLVRRAAQILAEREVPISDKQILLMASHNHNSPYYMTPSWGVWLFQDIFEIRAFEYHARQLAAAIQRAYDTMVPVRMGATVVRHTIYKGMVARQGTADDNTPRGYPETVNGAGGHGDFGVTVLRFDDLSGDEPRPLAAFANFGQHPESLDGWDLISADYLGPLERMVDREIRAPLIMSQSDTGSAEGPNNQGGAETLPDGVRRHWFHVGHAQTERGARYLADSIVDAWEQIGRGEGTVPYSSDFEVASLTAFVPGPLSHPYPSVSNCRSESTVEGNPGSPILGLPDCARAGGNDANNMLWEDLKGLGLPLPEHYDAPSFAAVQENLRLRLMTVRLGEVVLAACPCEPQVDLVLNMESRADKVQGNIFDGYDWIESGSCQQDPETTLWKCPSVDGTKTFTDERRARMQAQIHNDAAGWDDPENAVAVNAEPADPEQILGNFTKEELSAEDGYALPVLVGMAGDYNGYFVSYREYMAYDHYRKALTPYGSHTADYTVTRLVRMAAALRDDDPAIAAEILDPLAQADEARQAASAAALGATSSAAYDAWLQAIPTDPLPAAPLEQPAPVVERFGAATFTWRGGSNAADNPMVRIERQVDDGWMPFAGQGSEIQTMVTFPEGASGVIDAYAGDFEYRWTANFEVFDAWPARVIPGGQVPSGTYRFVVEGYTKGAEAFEPYTLESEPFTVVPWDGIEVAAASAAGGDVEVTVAPIVYPASYASGFPYISAEKSGWLCKRCTFRPWASTGAVASVHVTVARDGGGIERIQAYPSNGVWIADANLQPGDVATIEPGDVVDSFGEINGSAYPVT